MKQSPYYKAAVLIAEGEFAYSCNAISYAAKYYSKHIKEYGHMFWHDRRIDNCLWGSGDFSKENQLCRSLALLFMHEMYVRGEL